MCELFFSRNESNYKWWNFQLPGSYLIGVFFLRILHLIWNQRWATSGVYPVLSLRRDYDAVRLRPLEL